MVDTNNRENREYIIPDSEDINNNFWSNRVIAWWSGFSLRTKLLAIATLVVSLLMTGITFFALNSIQKDAGMNDTRYARDLGLLLSGNVTELVANNQKKNTGRHPDLTHIHLRIRSAAPLSKVGTLPARSRTPRLQL